MALQTQRLFSEPPMYSKKRQPKIVGFILFMFDNKNNQCLYYIILYYNPSIPISLKPTKPTTLPDYTQHQPINLTPIPQTYSPYLQPWKALYAAHEVDEERVDENGEDKEEEGGGGLGEAIEKEEVRVALKEMKKGKAVGELPH